MVKWAKMLFFWRFWESKKQSNCVNQVIRIDKIAYLIKLPDILIKNEFRINVISCINWLTYCQQFPKKNFFFWYQKYSYKKFVHSIANFFSNLLKLVFQKWARKLCAKFHSTYRAAYIENENHLYNKITIN